MKEINFPKRAIALPSKAQVKNLLNTPVVQMFCTSRSGTNALQAHLDGHPEVMMFGDVFKFYDFVYQLPLDNMDFKKAGALFIDSYLNAPLFDTSCSNTMKNRLGPDGNVVFKLDKQVFLETLLTLSKDMDWSLKHFFMLLHITYECCLGNDLSRKKVLFHHLHHGEWVHFEFLVNKSKLFGQEDLNILHKITAEFNTDKQIITLRNPYKAMLSVQLFCDRFMEAEESVIEQQKENQIELLAQELVRNKLLVKKGLPIQFMRLENLKGHPKDELQNICKFLGINAEEDSLNEMTFHGMEWLGDVSMVPKKGLRKEHDELPSNEDCFYLDLLSYGSISELGFVQKGEDKATLIDYISQLKTNAKNKNPKAAHRLTMIKKFDQKFNHLDHRLKELLQA